MSARMTNFTLGYDHNFLQSCFNTTNCAYPGSTVELYRIFSHILHQFDINMVPQKFDTTWTNNDVSDISKNNSTVFGSLESGHIATTLPWFALMYERFKRFGYVNPPPLSVQDALFVHNFQPNPAISLYSIMSPSIYALLIILECLACLVLMRSGNTAESTCKQVTFVSAYLNTAFQLSFQQRNRNLWKTWSAKLIITVWSLCCTKVILKYLSVCFIATFTLTSYDRASSWHELSHLLARKNYRLVVSHNTYFHRQLLESNIPEIVAIRQTLEKRKLITFSDSAQSEAFLLRTPGSVYYGATDSEKLTMHSDINMYTLNTQTTFSSMLLSRQNRSHIHTLEKHLNQASAKSAAYGFTIKILRKYSKLLTNQNDRDNFYKRRPLTIDHIEISIQTLIVGMAVAGFALIVEMLTSLKSQKCYVLKQNVY